MPDIITVSDSIDKLAVKARPLTQSITISEDLVRVTAHQKIRSLSEDVPVSDAVIRTTAKQVSKTLSDTVSISESLGIVRLKDRIISQTANIAETLQAYKNDQALIPPEAPTLPSQVPNLIGFRQQAVRAPRRAPRAILIEAELTNLIIAPLKLLAFSDSINKAIVGIRPRLVQNVALSPVSLVPQRQQAYSVIKMQSEPMLVKARLTLLSSPEMWATAKLKTRPESQSISALKAVNFEKMYKLTRIMKVAMLAGNQKLNL